MKLQTRRSSSEAFTLIEVMLAVGILALLVGMLWGMVKVSVDTAYYIEQTQIEQQQYVALNAFLENLFRKIPAQAQITSRLKDQGSEGLSLLYLSQAPGAISMLNQGAGSDTVVIGAREQIGGYVQLSLYTSDCSLDGADRGSECAPLDLIKGLAKIQWRYFDARSQQWVYDWLDSSTKPSLVELTLTPPGKSEVPRIFIYWIPPLSTAAVYSSKPDSSTPVPGSPNNPQGTVNDFTPRPRIPGMFPHGPRPLPGMEPQLY